MINSEMSSEVIYINHFAHLELSLYCNFLCTVTVRLQKTNFHSWGLSYLGINEKKASRKSQENTMYFISNFGTLFANSYSFSGLSKEFGVPAGLVAVVGGFWLAVLHWQGHLLVLELHSSQVTGQQQHQVHQSIHRQQLPIPTLGKGAAHHGLWQLVSKARINSGASLACSFLWCGWM